MLDIFEILGFWFSLIVGFFLLILELFVSGVFLMWFGLAAIATGIVAWLLQSHFPIFMLWQVQLCTFLFFSVLSVCIGVKFNRTSKTTDTPFLNNRIAELIGYTATLEEPIINGKGKIRIDDTLWNVIGPNLSAGTTVRVKSFKNNYLEVEAI